MWNNKTPMNCNSQLASRNWNSTAPLKSLSTTLGVTYSNGWNHMHICCRGFHKADKRAVREVCSCVHQREKWTTNKAGDKTTMKPREAHILQKPFFFPMLASLLCFIVQYITLVPKRSNQKPYQTQQEGNAWNRAFLCHMHSNTKHTALLKRSLCVPYLKISWHSCYKM